MVVPSFPFSHLIVRHTTFTFGVLKGTFNPKSLARHKAKAVQLSPLRGIGQGILYIRMVFQRLRHYQSPASGSLGFTIPNKDFQAACFNPENASGCFAKRFFFPPLWRKGLYKVTYLHAFLIGLIILERASAVCCFFRQIGLGIFQIYVKVRMHIHNNVSPIS